MLTKLSAIPMSKYPYNVSLELFIRCHTKVDIHQPAQINIRAIHIT
jgi:hypothetical protein